MNINIEERKKNQFNSLKGLKVGFLEVLYDYMDYTKSQHRHICVCKCHGCGKIVKVHMSNLKAEGHTTSCGCQKGKKIIESKIKHGDTKTKFYRLYMNIKNRCNNSKDKRYKDYGGRGIKCLWETYEDFKNDMYESYLEHIDKYGKDTSIDRIDVNGDYCKENCRWATRKEQCNNKRNNKLLTYNGETHNLKQWSEKLGINYNTLKSRLFLYRWSIEKTLSTLVKN